MVTHELFQPGNSWEGLPALASVNRVNIVDYLGNNTEYRNVVVDLVLQDDGRTLKVLIFE